MPSIMAVIEEFLFGAVKTFADDEGLRTAFPNVEFKPTKATYLRVQNFRNDPEDVQIKLEAEPIRRGLLQISVVHGTGKGSIKGAALADKVADAFTRGTVIAMPSGLSIRILQSPNISSPIQSDTRETTPVVIPWTVYPA